MGQLTERSPRKQYAEAAALIGHGAKYVSNCFRTETYVDKIFNGAKPRYLPVDQPTKFELFNYGKTAKALGLKTPRPLPAMADRVIE